MSNLPPRYGLFDLTDYIVKRVADFTGREWVFKEIDQWLGWQDASHYYLVTGEPGSGKSAVAARLAQFSAGVVVQPANCQCLTPGFLRAVHFCSTTASDWVDPRSFARSIALQLANIDEFKRALLDIGDRDNNISVQIEAGRVESGASVTGVTIHNLVIQGLNGQEAFNRTVLDPLRTIYAAGYDQPIIVLVDSLDEALASSTEVKIVDLLAGTDALNGRVRFILTSRPEPRVENRFLSASRISLSDEAHKKENDDDIATYVMWRLENDTGLASQIALLPPAGAAALPADISAKADGNFQYVTFLLNAAATGQQSLSNPAGLPPGLDSLYHESLRRVVALGKKDWVTVYQPFLGILSVALEPLALERLRTFTASATSLWNVYTDLIQFVEHVPVSAMVGEEALPENRYRLYHQSMNDFLHKQQLRIIGNGQVTTPPNLFYLHPGDWHEQITNQYWRDQEDWSRCDDYGLRHLAKHLHALIGLHLSAADNERATEFRHKLYGLLCPSWMRKKQARYGSQSFVDDVILTIEVARAENPPNVAKEIHGQLIRASIGTSAKAIPRSLLRAMARLRQTARARGYVALIPPGEQRRAALFEIAKSLQMANATTDAQDTLAAALTDVNALQDPTMKAGALSDLAAAFASIGARQHSVETADSALQVGRSVDGDLARAWALSYVATILAGAKLDPAVDAANDALKAFESVTPAPDGQTSAWVLTRIARAMAMKFSEKGKHTIVRAFDSLQPLDNTETKRMLLARIIAALDELDLPADYRELELSALAAMERLEPSTDLVSVLMSGASALLSEGSNAKAVEFASRALKVSRQSGDSGIDPHALARIFAAAGEHGRAVELAAEALDSARVQSDPEEKVHALVNVAEIFASASAHDQAAAIAQEALTAAKLIADPENASWATTRAARALAQALGQIGAFDRALAAIEQVVDERGRVDLLGELAEMMASGDAVRLAGQTIDRAVAALEATKDAQSTAYALVELTNALAEMGQKDRSAEIARYALAVSEMIELELPRYQVLRAIGEVLARSGEVELAGSVAERLIAADMAASSHRRVESGEFVPNLSEVARILAMSGRTERGVQIATCSGEPEEIVDELCDLATTLMKIGQCDKAIELVQRALVVLDGIESAEAKINALITVGDALEQVGQQGHAKAAARRALHAVEEINDQELRGEAWTRLAKIFARLGEAEEAGQAISLASAAGAFAVEQRRAAIFGKVAAGLASAEQPDETAHAAKEALQSADNSGDTFAPIKTRCEVALPLAVSGYRDEAFSLINEALSLTESIEDPSALGWTLSIASIVLTHTGHYEEACSLARRALRCVARNEDTALKSLVFVNLAESYSRRGGFREAAKLCARALEFLRANEESMHTARGSIVKAERLAKIVRVLTRKGDSDQLQELARAALEAAECKEGSTGWSADDHERAEALSWAVEALVDVGLVAKAMETANSTMKLVDSIATVRERSGAFASAARALAHARDLVRSAEAARRAAMDAQSASKQDLVRVLAGTARLFVLAGEATIATERALAATNLAKTIADASTRASALIDAAGALVLVEHSSTVADLANCALEAAGAIADQNITARVRIMAKIVKVLAQNGSRESAASVLASAHASVEKLAKSESRPWILRPLTEAAIETHFVADALKLWRAEVALAAENGYGDTIRSVGAGARVLACAGDGETLWRIYQHLVTLGTWWEV